MNESRNDAVAGELQIANDLQGIKTAEKKKREEKPGNQQLSKNGMAERTKEGRNTSGGMGKCMTKLMRM